MCFTVLVCNHLILFVLLCYEETVLLHLVLFVYFPNLSSYFLFQVVYLILGCCFKCFLPGTFGFFPFLPSVLFSSSLWYIFFFLKVNIILLCWWAFRSLDLFFFSESALKPHEPLSLFHSAASFSLVLTDWMPLDYSHLPHDTCSPLSASRWHFSFSQLVPFLNAKLSLVFILISVS